MIALDAEPGREPGLLHLSWPIFGQLALSYAIGVVDVYALGRVSDSAAAGAGSVYSLLTLVVMMFSFLSQGSAIVYAGVLGRDRSRSRSQGQRQSQSGVASLYSVAALVHAVVGAAASAGLWLFGRRLAALMGLEGAELRYGALYLQTVGAGTVLISMLALISGILTANGRTRSALTVTVTSVVCNLLLVYYLVLAGSGPRLGVRGVALSTVAANAVALGYGLVLCARSGLRPARLGGRREFARHARLIAATTVPTVVEPLLWQAAQIVTTVIIIGVGPQVIAARTYTLTITNSIGMVSVALAQGVQVLTAYLIGSGRSGEADRTQAWAVRIGLAASAGLAVAVALGAGAVMAVFTSDPRVVADGRELLLFALLYLPASSITMTTAAGLRASGDAAYPAYVGSVVLWGLFLPLAYLLADVADLGLAGVMIAMVVDENLRAVLILRRWQRRRVRLRPDSREPRKLEETTATV